MYPSGMNLYGFLIYLCLLHYVSAVALPPTATATASSDIESTGGVEEAGAVGIRPVFLGKAWQSSLSKPKLEPEAAPILKPRLDVSEKPPFEESSPHRKQEKTKDAFDRTDCPDCAGELKDLKEFCRRKYHYGIEAKVLSRDAKGYYLQIEEVHRNRTGVPLVRGQRLHVQFEQRSTQNLHFSRCPCPVLTAHESYFVFGKLKYHSKSRKHYFTISRAASMQEPDPRLFSAAKACHPDIPQPPPTEKPTRTTTITPRSHSRHDAGSGSGGAAQATSESLFTTQTQSEDQTTSHRFATGTTEPTSLQ